MAAAASYPMPVSRANAARVGQSFMRSRKVRTCCALPVAPHRSLCFPNNRYRTDCSLVNAIRTGQTKALGKPLGLQ